MSIEAPTLKQLLRSYVESFLRHGFHRVIIVPSHGGNFQTVAEAAQELEQEFPDRKIVGFFNLNRLIAASHELSKRYGISPGASGAHAGEFETSILLFLRPDLVNMKAAAEGFTGNIEPLIPDLLKHGLAGVTANGVLGDGRLGEASRGEEYLRAWLDLILTEVNVSA